MKGNQPTTGGLEMTPPTPSHESAASRFNSSALFELQISQQRLLTRGNWLPGRPGEGFETKHSSNEEVLELVARGRQCECQRGSQCRARDIRCGRMAQDRTQRARLFLTIMHIIDEHAEELTETKNAKRSIRKPIIGSARFQRAVRPRQVAP